jgi:hypothetical protein
MTADYCDDCPPAKPSRSNGAYHPEGRVDADMTVWQVHYFQFQPSGVTSVNVDQ